VCFRPANRHTVVSNSQPCFPHLKRATPVLPTLCAAPPADEDEEDDEEDDEPINKVAPKGKSKPAPSSVFALLNDDDGEAGEESEGGEEEQEPSHEVGLVVAEVVAVEPHPKADRLRVVRVDAGKGAVAVVTNAVEVAAGMRVVLAVSFALDWL
jgi:tRNA-binding EMAP/Myf-like protein